MQRQNKEFRKNLSESQRIRRGTPDRSILKTEVSPCGKYEISLHATKGYRYNKNRSA
jgi:hypothetical protein